MLATSFSAWAVKDSTLGPALIHRSSGQGSIERHRAENSATMWMIMALLDSQKPQPCVS